MKSDNSDPYNNKRIKISLLLANSEEGRIHKSYVDRIPERYKRSEYIIDKIYDPRKSVEII